MGVPNEKNKAVYAGDDATIVFSTDFTFRANDQVVVTLVDAAGAENLWVEGTQYTLTGADTGVAGSVTVKTAPTDFTPATGEQLVIQLAPAYTQPTGLPRGGITSPKSTLEPMHDDRVRQTLRLKDDVDRSLKVPIAETSINDLPPATNRASTFLAFDAAGQPIASTGPTGDSSIPVSTFMESMLDDTSAAIARSTIEAIATVVEDTSPQSGGAHDMNSFQDQWSKGADVECANALPLLTDGNYFDITTGVDTVTSINTTGGPGTVVKVHCDVAILWTHDGDNLIVSGGASYQSVAGDELEFTEYATGKYVMTGYALVSGRAIVRTGDVVQSQTKVIAASSGTGTIPDDDTTPLIGEGDELFTDTITLAKTSNTLRVSGSIMFDTSNGTATIGIAFFRGSTCIGSIYLGADASGGAALPFMFEDSPASASELTYSIRMGSSVGTHYWGRAETAKHNGEMAKHRVLLQEIQA